MPIYIDYHEVPDDYTLEELRKRALSPLQILLLQTGKRDTLKQPVPTTRIGKTVTGIYARCAGVMHRVNFFLNQIARRKHGWHLNALWRILPSGFIPFLVQAWRPKHWGWMRKQQTTTGHLLK